MSIFIRILFVYFTKNYIEVLKYNSGKVNKYIYGYEFWGKFDISDVVGLHAKLAIERSPQRGNMHFCVYV